MDTDGVLAEVRRLAGRYRGLRLLVLYGSRGRQQDHDLSDWDIGFLADGGFDAADLRVELTRAVGTDAVDLVDLGRASALLRFEAARQGWSVYERARGELEAFVLDATIFWCDVEPVIRVAQAAVLASLSD